MLSSLNSWSDTLKHLRGDESVTSSLCWADHMDMDSGVGSLVKLFCIFVSLLYIKFQARQNDHDILKSHVSLLDIKTY